KAKLPQTRILKKPPNSRPPRHSPLPMCAVLKSISAPSSRRIPYERCEWLSSVRKEAEMSTHHISITVNGKTHEADVESRLLLVHFLRENLNMTGTHIGCDTTSCGACTIQLNGKPVKSCTVLAEIG